MLHDKTFAKPDFSSGASQSITQFDIFDAWPEIGLVEAVQFQEDVPAYTAATGPEGGSVSGAILVNEMVGEVFVSRNEIRLGRIVIVRSDDSVKIGVLPDYFFDEV
jgi:hypothetical protein